MSMGKQVSTHVVQVVESNEKKGPNAISKGLTDIAFRLAYFIADVECTLDINIENARKRGCDKQLLFLLEMKSDMQRLLTENLTEKRK